MNIERRKFIATSATAIAGALISKRLIGAKEPEQQEIPNIENLMGKWHDLKLKDPTVIIITPTRGSQSNVQIMGCYWHKDHKQTVFYGAGTYKNEILHIEYNQTTESDENNNPKLEDGTLQLKLVKKDNNYILEGSAHSNSGKWAAPKMLWYKEKAS